MTDPSVPVAWCEIHNHEAATCECPEGAYEERHADCATVGQTCIAHTERPPSVPVESGDTTKRPEDFTLEELTMTEAERARFNYRARLASALASGDEAQALAVRDTEMEQLRAELEQFVNFAGEQANRVRELEAELAGLRERAAEVEKYWRDWPSERRAKVHALSRFLAGAIEDLAVTVESWRAAPESTSAPVSLERAPDAPTRVDALRIAEEGVRLAAAIGTAPARTQGRCPEHGKPYSMHHGPFQCVPDPAAPAEREWHLCHNVGSHHITDTFHGNDCDRPEHWDARQLANRIEQGDGK